MKNVLEFKNMALAAALFLGSFGAASAAPMATMMDVDTQGAIIATVEDILGADVSSVIDGMVVTGAFNPDVDNAEVIDAASLPYNYEGLLNMGSDMRTSYQICSMLFAQSGKCVAKKYKICKNTSQNYAGAHSGVIKTLDACEARGPAWYWDNKRSKNCGCAIDASTVTQLNNREKACKNIQSKISKTYCKRVKSPSYNAKTQSCSSGMTATKNQYRSACGSAINAAVKGLPKVSFPPRIKY